MYAVTSPFDVFYPVAELAPWQLGPLCTAHPAQALLRAWWGWHCQMQLPFDSFGFIHSFNCLLHCQFGIVVVPPELYIYQHASAPFPSLPRSSSSVPLPQPTTFLLLLLRAKFIDCDFYINYLSVFITARKRKRRRGRRRRKGREAERPRVVVGRVGVVLDAA